MKEEMKMTRFESSYKLPMLMTLLFAALLAGGGIGRVFAAVAPGVTVAPGTLVGAATEPTVISSSPSNMATNVPTSTNGSTNVVTGTVVTATFSQPMDPATVISSSAAEFTFTVKETTGDDVPGTVVMNEANTVATFTPTSSALNPNTSYTATVTMTAKNAAGVAMANAIAWSFTTGGVMLTGQSPVSLGKAGAFAILTKSGITDVPPSAINGDAGASPITGAAIHLTCAEMMSGIIYSVNAAGPLPCRVTDPTLLTVAVGDMETAYTDAAGRTLPNHVNLGAGLIGGLTLAPGLYKWDTRVLIATDVTLSGGANAVWIFQIAGTLTQDSATSVILKGGAQSKNIFWQASGAVAIGTTAHFEGTILAKTKIAMNTGASANGRLLAQTAVTLEQNAVTAP
jgi:ice-binding like protein/Big-like domain-containing protein